jgi:hypothetical protein
MVFERAKVGPVTVRDAQATVALYSATDRRLAVGAPAPRVTAPPEPPEKPTNYRSTGRRQAEDAVAEAVLPEAEWLAALPARASLKGERRKQFDANALVYRKFRPVRAYVENAKTHGSEKAKERGAETFVYERAFAAFLEFPHPRDWVVCSKCKGRGKDCDLCKSLGFVADLPKR